MDYIFILLILLAAVLLVIVAAGFFMPDSWTVEKAELVNAPAKDIFPLLTTLKEWESWTVWFGEEGDIDFKYTGEIDGVGSVQKWESKRINGTLVIQNVIENEQVDYIFHVDEGKLILSATIVLAVADANYTQVAWRYELKKLEDHNPVRRFQAMFIKNYIDKAMEESLLSLQSIFEEKTN